MKVIVTEEAEADLEAIGDYIAADNPRRAISFVAELRSRCHGLGDMPEAFPVVPRYERQGIRRRVHGNYLIFYRIEPSQVVILHVLNAAMDYDRVLAIEE
jgi:toxin ParE1/3/4